MDFVEGCIEGEKVFGGQVFPKTLLPPHGTCELAALVEQERHHLAGVLDRHGAILFRGFHVASAHDFARVVEAFGWDEFPYEGAADRSKVAHRIHTASEAPLHFPIPFHHEMALIKKFPPKVFFCCLLSSPEGGQTSIIPSNVVVEKMEQRVPHFVERLVQEGMRFVIHTKTEHKRSDSPARPVWQRMLKTTNKQEAEERALQTLACNSIRFNDDGTVDFNYGPMNPIRELKGKRVWFNTILGYESEERDAYASFDDGSRLSSDATDAFGKILEENCVDVNWQNGDLLLIDNLTVQHARRVGKPPREVLVSLCN